ncbi:MerR family DNA-binding protein [Sphingomonas sp. RHCKR7]|uniref:MerR family DNA-binding protein n=1 Tax=Sphingomonas folli TaxID=2862497 RepID=UPI001CA57790|nr:MerR family DNA-binding protein [Sphingomonas folli]MBW6525247.1 MerR family DNA-binding protein [Sphingomonas folli]
MSSLTIAGLARAGGVGVETVRFYQRRGLLETPARPIRNGVAGSVRRYDPEALRRLRFIRAAQSAGFTLEEIGELLQLDAADDRARAREMAGRRLSELDRKIAEMQAARTALARLAQDCSRSETGPCPILAAFDT